MIMGQPLLDETSEASEVHSSSNYCQVPPEPCSSSSVTTNSSTTSSKLNSPMSEEIPSFDVGGDPLGSSSELMRPTSKEDIHRTHSNEENCLGSFEEDLTEFFRRDKKTEQHPPVGIIAYSTPNEQNLQKSEEVDDVRELQREEGNESSDILDLASSVQREEQGKGMKSEVGDSSLTTESRKRGGFTGFLVNKVFGTRKYPGVIESLTTVNDGLISSHYRQTTTFPLNNNSDNVSITNGHHRLSFTKSSSESNIPLCHNSLENLTTSSAMEYVSDPESSNEPSSGSGRLRRTSCELDISKEEEDESSNSNGSSYNRNSGCRKRLEAEGFSNNPLTETPTVTTTGGGGPKVKLISEGDIQVCRVKHGQNLMTKLTSSKLLRRWETHHLYLNDLCISSKTPIGYLSTPISYWQMEEIYVVVRWDSGRRYLIRIVLPGGSLLLQASNVYSRDQWYHSMIWKKNIFKYQNLMKSSKRPEVIIKELKSLVEFATTTPLQDPSISHIPVEIVSNLLESTGDLLGKSQSEEVLIALSPLLEKSHPPSALCRFFSRYCQSRPRCPLVGQIFTPTVRRSLKHNVDFGKCSHMRRFIQDYFLALTSHNDGINVLRHFVKSMHGPGSSCPHPKVMSNLVSISLAAIFSIFKRKPSKKNNEESNLRNREKRDSPIPWDEELLCYLVILDTISEFDDWRPNLAQLLQPIPFPDEALGNPLFTRSLGSVIRRIGTDGRCDVHQMVLGIRDEKEGWFDLYSPTNLPSVEDFELWALILERLLSCCCRRKRFLGQLKGKLLGSCLLLALRENRAAQEALCLLLEWELLPTEDQRLQIATTLQSTPTGLIHYLALAGRQLHLKELQQKGGPRKLSLPSRSTDADLAKLLSCGSLGNLECLSLAFTQVTSACAEELIKLPSLRYLNLWSTQFGDSGLQVISEHLPNLQVLNLCETPISDKGLLSIIGMSNLKKLNLNSTSLSATTYQRIRAELPGLKEVDIRYTDAW